MGTQADTTKKNLDRLAALLKRKPLTARQVADELECCRPTAYQRIRALEERGDAVFKIAAPAEGTGPRPVAYGVR